MKASELIKNIQTAIDKVGDIEVCMVTRTGIEFNIVVCTDDDYIDGGLTFESDGCNNHISLDYE